MELAAAFAGGFEPADFAEVLGEGPKALSCLEGLREKSLLTGTAAGRLSMLALIREYALERCPPARRARLAALHARHFAGKADRRQQAAGSFAGWARDNWANLGGAYAWLSGRERSREDFARGCRLLLAIGEASLHAGHLASLVDHLDATLARLDEEPAPDSGARET